MLGSGIIEMLNPTELVRYERAYSYPTNGNPFVKHPQGAAADPGAEHR